MALNILTYIYHNFSYVIILPSLIIVSDLCDQIYLHLFPKLWECVCIQCPQCAELICHFHFNPVSAAGIPSCKCIQSAAQERHPRQRLLHCILKSLLYLQHHVRRRLYIPQLHSLLFTQYQLQITSVPQYSQHSFKKPFKRTAKDWMTTFHCIWVIHA